MKRQQGRSWTVTGRRQVLGRPVGRVVGEPDGVGVPLTRESLSFNVTTVP